MHYTVPGTIQNLFVCQKELSDTLERIKKEKDDKEKLAKEVKDLRAKVMHLEKEKSVLTKRLGIELANEHLHGRASADDS